MGQRQCIEGGPMVGRGEGNTKNHRGGIGEEEEVDWKTEESNEEERPRGQGFNNGSLVTAMWKSSEAATDKGEGYVHSINFNSQDKFLF